MLGIDSPDHLELHSARGVVFEGFVIGEFLKLQTTAKRKAQCFYWREHSRQEVDLLIDTKNKPYCVRGFKFWCSKFPGAVVKIRI